MARWQAASRRSSPYRLAEAQHALGLAQPEQGVDRQQLAETSVARRADHRRLGPGTTPGCA